jgi:hypothetical protein
MTRNLSKKCGETIFATVMNISASSIGVVPDEVCVASEDTDQCSYPSIVPFPKVWRKGDRCSHLYLGIVRRETFDALPVVTWVRLVAVGEVEFKYSDLGVRMNTSS